MAKNLSVAEIVKRAGGREAIAETSGGGLSADAVRKWEKIGIPDRYWPRIMLLANVSAAQLLAANTSARAAFVEAAE
jgi:hypothetical protein